MWVRGQEEEQRWRRCPRRRPQPSSPSLSTLITVPLTLLTLLLLALPANAQSPIPSPPPEALELYSFPELPPTARILSSETECRNTYENCMDSFRECLRSRDVVRDRSRSEQLRQACENYRNDVCEQGIRVQCDELKSEDSSGASGGSDGGSGGGANGGVAVTTVTATRTAPASSTRIVNDISITTTPSASFTSSITVRTITTFFTGDPSEAQSTRFIPVPGPPFPVPMPPSPTYSRSGGYKPPGLEGGGGSGGPGFFGPPSGSDITVTMTVPGDQSRPTMSRGLRLGQSGAGRVKAPRLAGVGAAAAAAAGVAAMGWL